MKLNGWQRLWVVLSAIWLCVWAPIGYAVWYPMPWSMFGWWALLNLGPPMATYALGLAIAWVIRGFKE